MPKKFFEDIKPLTSHDLPSSVPKPKKIIVKKDTIVSSDISAPVKSSLDLVDINKEVDDFYNNVQKTKKRSMVPWVFVLLIVSVFTYGALVVFSNSRIVLKERIEATVLDTSIIASKSENTGDLRFEIMSIEGSASKTILSETKKDIFVKATGIVVIYNDYSSSSQKLVANTRLQSPDGKIYRTQKVVTVPGKTGTGSESKPGSVEVSMIAEEGGASYNKEFSDFKIPGFKGSPRYDGFSVKTKAGSPVIGGKEGSLFVAKVENTNTLQTELSVLLREKLVHDARAQIPEGYYLFNDAFILSENENSIPEEVSGEDEKIAVSISGRLDAVLLPKEDLQKFIASKTLSQYDNANISIENIDTINFSFNEKYTNLKEVNEVSFNLVGSPSIVWDIDEADIKNALLGKSKKDFNLLMHDFKGVYSAELHLRPFFLTKIPSNGNKTKIIISRPEL